MAYDANSTHPIGSAIVRGNGTNVPAEDLAEQIEWVYATDDVSSVQSLSLPNTFEVRLSDSEGGVSVFSHDANETGAPNGASIIADTDGRKFVLSINGSSGLDGIMFEHSLSTGSDGGTATAGVNQRSFSVLENSILGADWIDGDDTITLPAGDYLAAIACSAHKVDQHQAWIARVSDDAALLDGMPAVSAAADSATTLSIVQGAFTLTASTEIRIDHWVQTTRSTDGFGKGNASGRPAIFLTGTIARRN